VSTLVVMYLFFVSFMTWVGSDHYLSLQNDEELPRSERSIRSRY
jgi:hypothetical protein